MKKRLYTPVLTILTAACAWGDFSYTTTNKITGGMMAAMAGQAGIPQTTVVRLKGRKMMVEAGKTTTIIDFDAETITSLNTVDKTWTVKKFGDRGADAKGNGMDIKIDAVETGQKKNVNGYEASELKISMEINSPEGNPPAQAQGKMPAKMTLEIDCWISRDVPGGQELRAFYKGMGEKFPWAAMYGGGGNLDLRRAMEEVQKKLASMDGVPVEQIITMKAPAGMAGGQQADAMSQARSKLEALKAQGGLAGAIAGKQLARMGGGSSGALLEMTADSTGFSAEPISEAVFSVPDGYRKAN